MDLRTFLKNWAEPCPEWLAAFNQGSRFDAEQFFASRVVFYPGSGHDGHAVKVFGRDHVAHCFVYADYWAPEGSIRESLDDPIHHFKGYHSIARISLTIKDLITRPWQPHAAPGHEWAKPHIEPYGFLEVLERDAEFGPDHGAERLAIIFLGADGHATYDALFCQGNPPKPPFAVLLQDHGFGGNYSKFGRGGVMEKIAKATRSRPEFLFVAENTKAWEGYRREPEVEGDADGMHGDLRFLFRKTAVDRAVT